MCTRGDSRRKLERRAGGNRIELISIEELSTSVHELLNLQNVSSCIDILQRVKP